MEYRTYLSVPSAQKDAVEALGAQWDPRARKWYVPESLDLKPFTAWLPVSEEEGQLRVHGPIFVAESRTTCRSCKDETPVIALAVEMLDETGEPYLSLLTTIEELPPDLSGLLGSRYPFFKKGFSECEEMVCMMNHCRCGALLEDFVLQGEPGESFFPTSPEEGMKVLLRRMPTSGCVVLTAGYSVSTENFIGLYAARHSF
jgi:Domain of unknown function (DUF5710)